MPRALDYLLLEPLRQRHFGLWRLRMSQVLHERTNGAFDELYVKWARTTSPPRPLGAPQFVSGPEIAGIVRELEGDGCSILPRRLSEADIDELTAFAFSNPAYAFDPTQEFVIKADAIPRDTARHVWQMKRLARVPAIQRLMLDPAFGTIAQDYLKAAPLLTSISLWIDAPADKPYGAHHYHYDNDGPGFLKFFFYLTDVEADTGAHCFIKGSHGHRKPPAFRISRIYEAQDLHAHYGRDKEIMFAAPRGTVIAEDTAGFHRGSTVVRRHRLLLQFQYSLLDIPMEEELKGLVEPVAVDHIPEAMRRMVSKFLVSRQ